MLNTTAPHTVCATRCSYSSPSDLPPAQNLPPGHVRRLRAVSGVLAPSGVEGLVALVRACPHIEEVGWEPCCV